MSIISIYTSSYRFHAPLLLFHITALPHHALAVVEVKLNIRISQ